MSTGEAESGPLGAVRRFFALERDVLVLSVALFAVSGLRFAGLPSHEALIVGPAERNPGTG